MPGCFYTLWRNGIPEKNKPRVLYIAYGETDEWAHAGQYRFYLDAAKQVDAWIKKFGSLYKPIRNIKTKQPY